MTTPRGYRYPAGSDAVTIATYFRNLATDVDGDVGTLAASIATLTASIATLTASIGSVAATVPKIQRGNVDVSIVSANTPTTTHVTFPTAFSSTPTVLADMRASFPILGAIGIRNETTTGFDVIYERSDSSPTAVTVDWIAILP